MSKSIKEAIAVDTFLDVKHLGGAAAFVIADDSGLREEDTLTKHFKFMNFGETKISPRLFYHSEIQKTKSSSSSFLVPTDQDILNQIKNSVV